MERRAASAPACSEGWQPGYLTILRVPCWQVRCLVDVPGDKLPSAAKGELAAYLRTTVAPQVPPSPASSPCLRALLGGLAEGLEAPGSGAKQVHQAGKSA